MNGRLKRVRAVVDYTEASANDSSKKAHSKPSRKAKKNKASLPKRLSQYSINSTFSEGVELLNEAINAGACELAFKHALNMYMLLDTHPENTLSLLQAFNKIRNKHKKTIGEAFYAWLLYVVAWGIQNNDLPIQNGNRIDEIVTMYTESATLGCHGARYNLASLQAERENLNVAFNHYMLYIQESDTPQNAYGEIGAFYELGWEGHAPDREQAMHYYRLGHNAGVASCSCNLARMMTYEKNPTEKEIESVFQLYRRAGELGFADGWYNLGELHLNGWHTPIDFASAEKYFRQACELNKDDKTNLTAVGEVILKNVAQLTPERATAAMEFLNQAIKLGSNEACYLKGLIYKNGNKYIARDPVVAMQTFKSMLNLEASREPNFVFAMVNLAELYLEIDDHTMLTRTINILSLVERLCIQSQQENNNIHPLLEKIIPTLIRARTERAEATLKMLTQRECNMRIQDKRSHAWSAVEDYKLAIHHSRYVSENLVKRYEYAIKIFTIAVLTIENDPALAQDSENIVMLKRMRACQAEAYALSGNIVQGTNHLQNFSLLNSKNSRRRAHGELKLKVRFEIDGKSSFGNGK